MVDEGYIDNPYAVTDADLAQAAAAPSTVGYDPGADVYTGSSWYDNPQYIAPIANTVLGLGGALASSAIQSGAARDAAQQQAAAYQQGLSTTQGMYQQQQRAFAPYAQTGYQGLAQMYGKDVVFEDPATGQLVRIAGAEKPFSLMRDPYTGEMMQAPSYEQEYTNKLSQYEMDPAVRAQRALDTKRLAQQEQARVGYSTPGASAARAAELGQKYDVSGFDRYRSQLADRYKALQGEFASKRDVNASEYDRLSQQINLGLGATKQLASSGTNYANQASNLYGNIGQAQASGTVGAGTSQANMWSGLGNIGNTAVQGANAWNQYGQNQGWWG